MVPQLSKAAIRPWSRVQDPRSCQLPLLPTRRANRPRRCHQGHRPQGRVQYPAAHQVNNPPTNLPRNQQVLRVTNHRPSRHSCPRKFQQEDPQSDPLIHPPTILRKYRASSHQRNHRPSPAWSRVKTLASSQVWCLRGCRVTVHRLCLPCRLRLSRARAHQAHHQVSRAVLLPSFPAAVQAS